MLLAFIAAIAVKLQALFDAQVPVGYEDETGFHAGIDPVNKRK